MTRKKKKNAPKGDDTHKRRTRILAEEAWLREEAKKSVWAIISLGLAIFFFLAAAQKAGPFGEFIFRGLSALFGLGYYLAPLVFMLISAVFLTSEGRKASRAMFFGSLIFTIASLGIIDLFSAGAGGLFGSLVGKISIPLGDTASFVMLFVLLAVSVVVIFNAPIVLKRRTGKEEGEEEREETTEISVQEITPSPAQIPAETEEVEKREAGQGAPSVHAEKTKRGAFRTRMFGDYVPPPLSLLRASAEKPNSGDLRANANIIRRTLEGFGISVEMSEINVGPKVTRYTLKPAEGVKLSRIIALNQDLALALAAHPIRIEAPIPGKSLVGVEVPNKAAAIVRLGSLLNYREFQEAGLLGFALGRDVNGVPWFVDIDKMPHLLVAGSTGSGKSISIHALIISLLYKNSPATLRLLLIDPKRVELAPYNGLPHLVSPVITEPKKAIGALRWMIEEMNRRYEVFLSNGSRDIESYNKKHSGEPLPYLLLVIDELADLMSAYGREIEGSVVRLAQMARATGLHLILSTQRPSVEVVTGLIKANITSRIALQLPSQTDSRTVLDCSGAEKLLGGGDMLFVSAELSKPRRIQGAYVSEEEMQAVTEFIKAHNKPGEEIEVPSAQPDETGGISEFLDEALEGEDEFLTDAIEVVRAAKKASASLLQRRLKVGYARAARLLDIMEERGIVGPADGARPREVY